MEDISKNLYELLKQACDSCQSKTIALSGGLDSTILAYFLKDKNPRGVAVIAQDFVANDLTYCQMVSKQFGIPLAIHSVGTAEILNAVEKTIRILKNFNDIEIRNNVVMYLAIKWTKEQGEKGIITGDGADELFAGYNFLVKKSKEQLEEEINRVCSVMHFPTQEIGKAMDINIESPFLDKNIIDFAKNIPSEYKVREEKGTKYGKWILRKTFEKKIPHQIVWREKSPMQDGSGTVGLTNLFESIVSDEIFLEKKKNIEKTDGVKIRTKESMYYYEIFRRDNKIPENNSQSECPYCKYNVENSKFCRMCGAFPI